MSVAQNFYFSPVLVEKFKSALESVRRQLLELQRTDREAQRRRGRACLIEEE